MSEDKPESVIVADIEAAIARLMAGTLPRVLSAEQKAIVLAMVREGSTLTAICRREGMPALSDIYATCERDALFAGDLDQARRIQATARLDRAQDTLDAAMASNDLDSIRGAAVYTEQTTRYAEKIAPREYGQLVKLAGADGGAITVNVVDYAAGTTAERVDASPARGSIEAASEGDTQSGMGTLPG